jgi:hypothetical protein
MAEVTLNTWVETGDPNVEVVKVSLAASLDTYHSRKFKTVSSVQLCMLGAIAITDAFSVTLSGNVITFVAIGTTNPTLYAEIRGHH